MSERDWYQLLSPKEREVLEAYAELHSYKAVAAALGRSESAVDQRLTHARRKMGACSTAEAMSMLARWRAEDDCWHHLPAAYRACRLRSARA